MQSVFGHLGLDFYNRLRGAAGVCLDAATAGPAPRPDKSMPADSGPAPDPAYSAKASQWAEKALNFKPSAKQADLLDSDAKYIILCCNRQWGKTTTIALKALHRALYQPRQSIVIISRTKLQAGILIERACNFALALGYPIRRALGQHFSLKLPNGSAIFAVAHSQDTSVGNTAHVLIVDEAALVTDQVFTTVSAFVGRTHGSIWLLSTPRRQAGFFYNIWHSKDTRWLRLLSTIKDCPEIDPDFLAMQKMADPIKYRQDFLCEFIQPADRLISREAIDRMVNRNIDQWHVPQWAGSKPSGPGGHGPPHKPDR